MRKFPLIFLICISSFAFIFNADSMQSTSVVSGTWSNLTNLPYTLSHNTTIASDSVSSKILILGGIAGDSISSQALLYNPVTGLYSDSVTRLPKKLMNGFSFRIKDSVYYGGGYTTNWRDTSFTSDTLYDAYTSGTTTFAGGQNGKIYLTTNNFVNWRPKGISFSARNIVAISMVNNLTGWVIGNKSDSSSVYFTSDSASNFTRRLTGNTYNDLFFINAATGWVCGNAGVISRTLDTGVTWSTQTVGTDNFKSVYFVNSSLGYICGANGKIVKTTNGGVNWTTLTTNTSKNLTGIVCDSAYAYCCGDSGTVIKTTNNGTNWQIQTVQTNLNFKSIEKVNSQRLIISGERGAVVFTSNGGTEWSQRVGVTGTRLNRITISQSDTIPVAIGINGKIIKASRPFFEYAFNTAFFKLNVKNPTGGWVPRADMPMQIAEVISSSAVIINKTGFVFGGRTTGFNYSDSVMRYNPLSNTWSFAKKLRSKLSEGAAAVVDGNKVILAGGKNSSGICDSVYIATMDTNNAGGITVSWSVSSSPVHLPYSAMGSKGFPSRKFAFFAGGNTTAFSFIDAAPSPTSSKVFFYNGYNDSFTEVQLDAVNPVSHTGLDGFISNVPFDSDALDSAVRIFAPGGRDTNYLPLNTHKVLKLNVVVSIKQVGTTTADKYYLGQNYPNPFNPVTKIIYELPVNSKVEFKVFDMTGKEIYVNRAGIQNAGKYEISFNGLSIPSGVYFYRLNAGNYNEVKKMVLIK